MAKRSNSTYLKRLFQKPSDQGKAKYIAFTEERIYGTVTLMAISIGLLFQTDLTAGTALSIIISTALGLWLASMFAAVSAYRIGHDKSMPRSDFFHEITIHRGLIFAAIPTILMLMIALYGFIEVQTAILASLAIATVSMIAVIIRSANTARNTLSTAVIIVAAQIAIALAVIVIKLKAK